MSIVVHLRSAVCLLGRFPALAGADLDVAAGEIVLLAGPNGAGKTTLLRALAGLIPVVDGTAVVLGVDVRKNRRGVRRRVGMLGHATGLYDDLNVVENLTFSTRAAGGDADRVPAALDRCGVGAELHHLGVARLSAGQRRRVALAALVARDPELWLMDEPHAALDPDGRDLLDGVVRDAAGAGRTVVMASHDLARAQALADRTVAVAGGSTVRTADQKTGSAAPNRTVSRPGGGEAP